MRCEADGVSRVYLLEFAEWCDDHGCAVAPAATDTICGYLIDLYYRGTSTENMDDRLAAIAAAQPRGGDQCHPLASPKAQLVWRTIKMRPAIQFESNQSNSASRRLS